MTLGKTIDWCSGYGNMHCFWIYPFPVIYLENLYVPYVVTGHRTRRLWVCASTINHSRHCTISSVRSLSLFPIRLPYLKTKDYTGNSINILFFFINERDEAQKSNVGCPVSWVVSVGPGTQAWASVIPESILLLYILSFKWAEKKRLTSFLNVSY